MGLARDKPLRLVLIYSSNPLTQRTYLALDAMWAPFGVRIDARGLESRAYSLALNAGDFDLMDYGPFSAVQSATSFIGRFRSDSFLNYSGYVSAEVDRLIELAERQVDPAARCTRALPIGSSRGVCAAGSISQDCRYRRSTYRWCHARR
jgi:ABC-type transport system substrate-binding protein